jgi:enamine deaminase RidA (YjgF/YER057c/UK114 family)
MSHSVVNPSEWKKPAGYSNAILARGQDVLFLGGQVAFDADARVVGRGDLVAQFRQTLENIATVCRTAGARLDHIVKLTIFVQNRDEYRARGKELGAIYREHFGKHYPAMTLVEVARFFEPDVLIEIEGIAVLDASTAAR